MLQLLSAPQTLQWVQVISNLLFLLSMARALPYAVERAMGRVKIEIVAEGGSYELE